MFMVTRGVRRAIDYLCFNKLFLRATFAVPEQSGRSGHPDPTSQAPTRSVTLIWFSEPIKPGPTLCKYQLFRNGILGQPLGWSHLGSQECWKRHRPVCRSHSARPTTVSSKDFGRERIKSSDKHRRTRRQHQLLLLRQHHLFGQT